MAKKSRPTALVHKSLHDHVVGDLTARVKGLEAELSRRSNRIADLEAQLSRGVFVREMSDEELYRAFSVARCALGHSCNRFSVDGDIAATRACIAAATKLPEGAVRNSVQVDDNGFFLRLVFDGGRRDAIVMSQESSGRLHIVFVPEPVDSPETAR